MDNKPALSVDDLRRIAGCQKGIILCVLAYFVLLPFQFALPADSRVYVLVAAVPLAIIATVCVFLLATKIYSTGKAVILGVLTLLPYIGLFALLVINAKATRVLKKHGIRVGLLGANVPRPKPSPAELRKRISRTFYWLVFFLCFTLIGCIGPIGVSILLPKGQAETASNFLVPGGISLGIIGLAALLLIAMDLAGQRRSLKKMINESSEAAEYENS